MSRVAVFAAAAGVALIVGAGTAVAIDVTSADPISACVSNKNGTLRILQSGQTCNARTETPLTWNVQGPQGPPARTFVAEAKAPVVLPTWDGNKQVDGDRINADNWPLIWATDFPEASLKAISIQTKVRITDGADGEGAIVECMLKRPEDFYGYLYVLAREAPLFPDRLAWQWYPEFDGGIFEPARPNFDLGIPVGLQSNIPTGDLDFTTRAAVVLDDVSRLELRCFNYGDTSVTFGGISDFGDGPSISAEETTRVALQGESNIP